MQIKSPLQRIRRGALALLLIVALSVIGFRYFGDYDWIGAVWMVVITISTVGYSEQSNFDPMLKLYTVMVILFGMTAAAYTFGGLFQLIMEGELDRVIGKQRMTRDLNRMKGHTIVCGYGRMGHIMADELTTSGRSVVAIDLDPKVIQDATRENCICWLGDATEEATLLAVGIERATTLIISLPNDAESVFITLTARNLNNKLQIIARAEKQSTEKKLRQAGANKVVLPTIVGAKQMVRLVTRPTTADLMELVSEAPFETWNSTNY
ncbi:MAG: potassium channel family protein [Pirellulaceae bacterium]